MLTMMNQAKRKRNGLPFSLLTLPKAELHVHIEGGTLGKDKIQQLAKKYDLPEPTIILGEDNNIHFNHNDFLDFLRAYDLAASYILTVEDIESIAYEYLAQCARMGAIYVEMICSPDHVAQNRTSALSAVKETNKVAKQNDKTHQNQQEIISNIQRFHKKLLPQLEKKYQELSPITYSGYINAVAKAIERARIEFDIEARILIVLLRHESQDKANKIIDDVINHPHPYVVGINLAGDEERYPPELFKRHYENAKAAGLKCSAHAGEHVGAEYIKKAIDVLGLDRVGHATSALQDPSLLEWLQSKNIGIEANITSNLVFTQHKDIKQHPFSAFFQQGLLVSLNTDDPTYVGTTLAREYQLAQETWQLSDENLLQVTKNAIKSAFCDEALKSKLMARIALYEKASHFKNLVNVSTKGGAIANMLQAFSIQHLEQVMATMDEGQSEAKTAAFELKQAIQQYQVLLTCENTCLYNCTSSSENKQARTVLKCS